MLSLTPYELEKLKLCNHFSGEVCIRPRDFVTAQELSVQTHTSEVLL